MIFQLNIIIKWLIHNYHHQNETGEHHFVEICVGETELKKILKRYEGIEIIKQPLNNGHQSYYQVIHEIKIS